MQLTVNGQSRNVPDGATAAQLLALLGLQGQRLAVEVNREIVPRSALEARRLVDGDTVEIVRAIGGG